MIKIFGASDDLIEIEGDIREELSCYDEISYIAFSNGALLEIEYDVDGIWRIKSLFDNNVTIKRCTSLDDDGDYSDIATINAKINWIMYGKKDDIKLITK